MKRERYFMFIAIFCLMISFKEIESKQMLQN